ncbi:hypothetical protein CHUAL_010448 [Chamberlinius hualienensis]
MATVSEELSTGSISGTEIGVGCSLESFVDTESIASIIEQIKSVYKNSVCLERCLEQFTNIFDKYQEQPHLLDPYLDIYLSQLLDVAMDSHSEDALKHQCFKLLYTITKVRGYKVVLRHLPHEVSHLEPVLYLLDQQDSRDTTTWETRYMLLLWLSIIVMIPFQLTRLDANTATELGKKRSVVDRILDAGKHYIMTNDKPQDAAAYLTSRFVTRPDVKGVHLERFIDWTLNGASIGQMSALALLFKHGKREDLLPLASRVLNNLQKKDIKSVNNTILRKLFMKLTQRLGITFLKPRIASWRYQRGSRSLELNLTSQQPSSQSRDISNEEDDEDFDVPEEIEIILQNLLMGLNDKDTVIRWSAAKGIGRVAGRLPKELADEVVGSVLELFSSRDRDAVWHGGCLALAELGRRGLLLPERLSDVVPVVIKGLVYDEQKGSYSVGDHIRDAACYVCWSFARAYDPLELKPYVNDISSALLTVTVFDREIHCRRAASAAFQENVGRQGTFPHGIDIVTTADYFAVGNRTNAFTNISVFIAQYPEYTKALINHLIELKINHWDSSIRELTSLSLHKLAPLACSYMKCTVLSALLPLATGSDMNTRHGAILSLAEIIHSLFLHNEPKNVLLDENLMKGVRDIVPILQEKKLFRGFGSELIRTACCKLIEKLSLSKLPFHGDPIIEIWQNVIDDSLRVVDFQVLKVASATITPFCVEYYQSTNGIPHLQKQEWLINNYLHELQSPVETTRMGFTMALGALPAFIMVGKLEIIIPALIECTIITEKTSGWVKARREALISLVSICKAVEGTCDDHELKAEYLQAILECHLDGLNDYTIDSCGDVGSHVRNASLQGIKTLVELMTKRDKCLISTDLSQKIICSVIKQCVEKIENIRKTAGNTFYSLLYGDPSLQYIPHREELGLIFPEQECHNITWSRPTDTFPKFASMLSLPTYVHPLLLGFSGTIGSLSEHLVRVSIPALGSYLKFAPHSNIEAICDTLLKIFEDNLTNTRLTLPLLKTIDQLLSTGYFDNILQQSGATFGLKLFVLVKKEISTCKDPAKIMSGVSVLCDLLPCESNCRSKVLFQLCLLLCHSWPLIRKDAATKMFTAFATYDGLVENEDLTNEVMTLLSETNWVEAREIIRPVRNNLCDILNIQRPVFVGKNK